MVAKDQETVVIGGLIQERTIESGDKSRCSATSRFWAACSATTRRNKTRTNLLLFLTPYIIRDQSDFRRIFERKMPERQEFVERSSARTTGLRRRRSTTRARRARSARPQLLDRR